jgi:hypothetical protein
MGGQVLLGASAPGLRGFVQAAGGWHYRSNVRADTLYSEATPASPTLLRKDSATETSFSADAGVWVLSRLMLAGNASWTSETGRGATLTRLEAGPTVIYRVDDALDLIAGSSHTLAGENAALADRFFVGLAFKGTKLTRYQGFMGTAEER